MPQTPLGKMYAENPSGATVPVQADADGNLIVSSSAPVVTQTTLTSSSGNKANTNAVATLHPATGKTAYIAGFQLGASGATAGLGVTATVAGVLGGTMSYSFNYPAGAAVGASPINVKFDPPIPASAADVDIVITLPASGTGGLIASASAQGFYQ